MPTQTIKQHKTLLILVVLVAVLVAACASPVQSSSPTQAAQPQPVATTASAAPTAQSQPAAPTDVPVAASTDPIYLGVSGPLTGQNARYGAQWKKGFRSGAGRDQRFRRRKGPQARVYL